MTFRIVLMLLAVVSIWSNIAFATGATSIDPVLARQYFQEIKMLSDADAGHLWGVAMYGPILLVDPKTRSIVANQADSGGQLRPEQGAYVGTLNPEINVSNTAVEWSGVHWTMVNWNAISDTDPYERARLLIHESWHRKQQEIGILPTTTSCAYLDEVNGRVLLLLEFRALANALSAADSSDMTKAISDALTFRQHRQSQFPGNNENDFERHEGLAEYTGLKLCGLPDSLLVRIAFKKLQLGESSAGLANSFAYLTGPALGLLLDRFGADWRARARTGGDLPSLLAAAIGWHAPVDKRQLDRAADSAGAEYGAAQLLADETARVPPSGQIAEAFRNRLLAHGQLLIPNHNLNFSFNPSEELTAYDTTGVIYKTMRLTGDFGVLEVTDQVLRTNNWQFFVVAAPDKVHDNPIVGEGYTLQLSPDWQIVTRGEGIFVVKKK